jgi:diaminopropionate ammonia-lyase
LLSNPSWQPDRPWQRAQDRLLPAAACERAIREIARWPGYAATPVVGLPGLARRLGLARLDCKYEGDRFGVGSFKGLGAPYALAVLLAHRLTQRLGRRIVAAEVIAGSQHGPCAACTAAAATDGNHGRALAWAAAQAGCAAVIYVPAQISDARVAAITALGARVERVAGSYDDAVRRCASDCRRDGWLEITDTAPSCRPGTAGLASARLVMAGYTVLIDEALAALAEPPTHLFAQAGVGGFAAAAAARLWQRLGSSQVRTVVVEPERAACFYASALAGTPSPASGDLATIMAGLACGEPSVPAWQLLSEAAAGFLAVPDPAAVTAVQRLAAPLDDDPPLRAGETGGAGLAGLLAVAGDPTARAALGLTAASRVLVVATEAAK